MSTIEAPFIRSIIAGQFAVVGLVTAGAWVLLDWTSTYSVLLGGLICAVPNAYFSLRAFRHRGASSASRIVRDFYFGEAIKLLMAAAGFALTFVYVEPLNAALLFAAYMMVYVSGLVLLIRSTGTGKQQSR